MESREELEKRVADLEKQVATLKAGGLGMARRVRRRASWRIGNLPFYDIALGPDPERGEVRGHAKGVIAIGDIATGVVALGGIARGLVAIGGLAIGVVSFGGLALGILLAVGGLAVGSVAFGGAAVGRVAVGGGAVGYYACGGQAAGDHVIDPRHRDPEAQEFFRRYGLDGLCRGR